MTQIINFSSDRGQCLAITGLPENAKGFSIVPQVGVPYLKYHTTTIDLWLKLPPGEWQILGRTTSLTEMLEVDIDTAPDNIIEILLQYNPLILTTKE